MTDDQTPFAPASLLAIGAPAPDQLDALAEQESLSRIVFVEPDPKRAEALEERFAGDDRVKVIAATLGAEAGEAEIQIFNYRGARSVHVPGEAMRALLPGLKTRSRVPVTMMTPAQLHEQIGVLPSPLALRIEALGSEMDILKGWQAAAGLEGVARIQVSTSTEAMFENGPAAPECNTWMQAHGFVSDGIDEEDPDWPVLVFRPDPVAREHLKLRGKTQVQSQRIGELEKRVTELKAAVDDRTGALAQMEEQRGKAKARIQELETSLTASWQTEEASQKKIGELEQALAVAQQEVRENRDIAQRRGEKITQLEAALEAERGAVAEQEAARKQQAEQVAQLTAQLASAQESATQQAQRIAQQKQKLDTVTQAEIAQTARIESQESCLGELEAALDQAKAEATHHVTRIQELETALDRANLAMEADQQRLSELEEIRADQHTRLELACREMRRAEGQVEMIREILLREARV